MNPPSKGHTILVVDDEPEVLELIRIILMDDGHRVITASGADMALTLFRGLENPPDLLVADVVMPGMSGPMLVERLTQFEPELRILFMSAYDSRQVVRRFVVEKGYSLISKPFKISDLRAAVKEELKVPRRTARWGLAN